MTYAQYIASDQWRARRSKRLIIDKHRCQGCGSTTDLHVHHRTYERFGAEKMDDLVTVCSICHLYIHRERARTKQSLAQVTDASLALIRQAPSTGTEHTERPFVPRHERLSRRQRDWRHDSRNGGTWHRVRSSPRRRQTDNGL